MTSISWAPDGEPLCGIPADYFQLVPDEALDEIYDTFDHDAPIAWQIEWDGERHELIAFGWVNKPTDEGYDFMEFWKISVPLKIPDGYVHIDAVPNERTIQ